MQLLPRVLLLATLVSCCYGFSLPRLFNIFGWTFETDQEHILEKEHRAHEEEYNNPNLLELAQELNLTTCLERVKEARIDRVINHEGWFTLFCPTNEAFLREKEYPGEDSGVDKMRMHVAKGKFDSTTFKNEHKFSTLLARRFVRMNVYNMRGQKVVTANGRRLLSTDHKARNGYLHILDNVMSSVYKSSGSVIYEMEKCCPQHSELINMAKLSGIYTSLDSNEPITLLAPVNKAFYELNPQFLDHLKKDKALLHKVMSAHVLPGSWYTPGLYDGQKIKSWAGDFVTVQRDQDNNIRFSSALSLLTDITATNGAVQAIDKLIFPRSAERDITELYLRVQASQHRQDQ